MNIFVNKLGKTCYVQIDEETTFETLSQSLHLPISCRYSYAGRLHPSTSPLPLIHSLRLHDNSTLNILLPIVGGGPAKCHISACTDRVARLIGVCRWCQGEFCTKHRLPESHECKNLTGCKQVSHAKNSDKLLNGKCVADKV
jgi:AN1-like Zinc finger